MKNNLTNMMGLDLYLSSLSTKEYEELEEQFEPSPIKTTPLLSWDIFSTSTSKKSLAFKKEREIKSFFDFAEKFKFDNDFEAIFSSFDFEALLITNTNKEIVWVSNGFKEMTGYSKKFALTQTPGFLQGKQTSVEVKKKIRKNIIAEKPFTETIVNYKKDNTPYKCEIRVYPLQSNDSTYFLALEREVA